MFERSSALASAKPFSGKGLIISESPDFTLTQYSGSENELKKALGKIPAQIGVVLEHNGRTQLRINTKQIWVIGEQVQSEACISTPLSSSRTRIGVEGEKSRVVLAKLSAIDFHPKQFKPDMFVQTGIHHTPALIHCMGENTFHIYAMRTFGVSVWEKITDAGLEFAV
jgi:sarcosine oxidase gamma subunit